MVSTEYIMTIDSTILFGDDLLSSVGYSRKPASLSQSIYLEHAINPRTVLLLYRRSFVIFGISVKFSPLRLIYRS